MEPWLIGLLAFLAVTGLGGAVLAARRAKREPLQRRIRQLQGQEAILDDDAGGTGSLAGVVARAGDIASSGRVSDKLKREMAMAGIYGAAAPSIYLGAKLMLCAVGLMVTLALIFRTTLPVPVKVLVVAFAGAGLSFIPNVVLAARKARRRREIVNHMPDVVDLLEICVSSGMGLDTAWNLVSDSIRRVSPTFADEMALTNLEMHLGAPRTEAMRHMSQRTGARELSSLVAVLVQSERFGTSISDALRAFAISMREGRSFRAEETAEKMAVKLLFPMVVFIFPAILVVVAGAAGIKLVQIMSSR